MPNGSIKSSTGNAQIKKMGHTENGRFGSDPDKRVRGGQTVKELGVKSK